jgi:chemotaxis protein MotA
MDWASLAGLALALAGILLGQTLEGGKLGSLLQPAAFAIVVVGTLGAVLLQSRLDSFLRGMYMLRWVFVAPPDQRQYLADEIGLWNLSARRDGLLSLEKYMQASADKFIAKGLRLIVDGINPDKLREILDVDISALERGERQAVKIWESAAGYAPTIGILGAVLGLIHVMENLSDPSKLGSGIAVAFVSTIYGVGLANLLFYPVANKLKAIVTESIVQHEIVAAVFYDIASGDHSRVIEERVAGLLRQH